MFSILNVQKNVNRWLYQGKSTIIRLLFSWIISVGILFFLMSKVLVYFKGIGGQIIAFLVVSVILAFDYGIRSATKLFVEERLEIRSFDFIALGFENFKRVFIKNAIYMGILLLTAFLNRLFFRKYKV